MTVRVWRMAVADFRERRRRPAYAVTLLAAVALAYLAVPGPGSRWTILDVGGYRGLYTSAYVGAATALASALWLTVGGFYVVRTTVGRDEATGVGRLLGATPLPTWAYLVVKWVSNVLVLASMAGVAAAAAVVLQLVRAEDAHLNLVVLAVPYLVVVLPLVVLTAAVAVVFETTPVLRGGVGNVCWFFLAVLGAIAGQSAAAPLGGLGVGPVAQSMAQALRAQGVDLGRGGGFSLGLTYQDGPLRTFRWDGADFDGGFLLGRVVLCLLAVCIAVAPVLWFRRFDPAHDRRWAPGRGGGVLAAVPAGVVGLGSGPARSAAGVPPSSAVRPGSVTVQRAGRSRHGGSLCRLVVGEVRILVQGLAWWWWAVAAAITALALVLPRSSAPAVLLGAWVWPLLIWSRLGTQRVENDVEGLLLAYPRPRRRLLAEWASGVALTAVLGCGPAVVMVAGGDRAGLGAWAGAVLVIPSAALLLGVGGRTHRLFQVIYLLVWFLIVNGVDGVDFMGARRVDGAPVGPAAGLVVLVAVLLLALAGGIDHVRSRGLRPIRRQRPRDADPAAGHPLAPCTGSRT